jgi:hypothetical protein
MGASHLCSKYKYSVKIITKVRIIKDIILTR